MEPSLTGQVHFTSHIIGVVSDMPRIVDVGVKMPYGKHYSGKGEKVMASMKKQYGPEKAKEVFYATENKRKKKGSKALAGLKKAR